MLVSLYRLADRLGRVVVKSGLKLAESVSWAAGRGRQPNPPAASARATAAAGSAPGSTLENEFAKRADALLHDAYTQHNLGDAADRRIYALQSLLIDPNIHHHTLLEKRLAHAREGAISYVAACRDLDEATLRRFAAELSPPTRMSV